MPKQTYISVDEAEDICSRAGVEFDAMWNDFHEANDAGLDHGVDAVRYFDSMVQEYLRDIEDDRRDVAGRSLAMGGW